MADDEVVYVVADGVTLYVNDDTVFNAGDVVTAEDFDSLAEFRGLLAAKKIVKKGDVPPEPEPQGDWDLVSIDEHLDADSPNPVSNRALTKAIEDIEAGGAVAISLSEIEDMWGE